jgi:hypothetical protein
MQNVTPDEFAKRFSTDSDWLPLARSMYKEIPVFETGDRVICNGYEGSISQHYYNGMWEVRMERGMVCESWQSLTPISRATQ